MPSAVKFCGLTRPDDAALAARLGAAYVGAIFAGGPRLVGAAQAREVFAAARSAAAQSGGPSPRAVGVMGTQSPDVIARIAEDAALDVVQLHADPSAEDVRRVRAVTPARVWAVVRVAGVALPPATRELLDVADAVVLDAKVLGALGGTGVALEWDALAADVARARGAAPIVLAGGLTPENVARAIAALAPDIVDVSSGVESAPGLKDHARMRAFAESAS